MKYVVVDVEADGPYPVYSMLSLGAVDLDDLTNTFYIKIEPQSDSFVPEALAASGFTEITREDGIRPTEAMREFQYWLSTLANGDRIRFVSDNAGFDWQFVNYYFHYYLGRNPFGFSPLSITSLYNGLTMDMRKSFKHLRDTKHTHNALDDAIGNAEALNKLRRQIRNL